MRVHSFCAKRRPVLAGKPLMRFGKLPSCTTVLCCGMSRFETRVHTLTTVTPPECKVHRRALFVKVGYRLHNIQKRFDFGPLSRRKRSMELQVFLKRYAVTAVIAVILDILWLGVFAKSFYSSALAGLARATPLLFPALLVYLLIPLGLTIYALPGTLDTDNLVVGAAVWGAPFGAVLYGVYELTNYAVLEHYKLSMVVIDWIWGTFLCFISTLGAATVLTRFMTDRGRALLDTYHTLG